MRWLETRSDGRVPVLSPSEKKITEVYLEAEEPFKLTNSQVASRAGVSTRAVIRFKENREIRAYLNYAVERSLPDIFLTLLQRSKSGHVKSTELLFKVIGLLRENYTDIVQIFNFGKPEETQKSISEAEVNSLLGIPNGKETEHPNSEKEIVEIDPNE